MWKSLLLASEKSRGQEVEGKVVSFRKKEQVLSGSHRWVIFPETESRSLTWCSVQNSSGFPSGFAGAPERNAWAVGLSA